MNQKRGSILVIALIFLIIVVLSVGVYASGCCYGEFIGCENDIPNKDMCDALAAGDEINTFVDNTACDDLSGNECESICCCLDDYSDGYDYPRFRCDVSKGYKIIDNADSCDAACQNVPYFECPVKDCNSANPIDYASAGCYCTPDLQLDADHPFCCEAAEQSFAKKEDCPAPQCRSELEYILVGYTLYESGNIMKDVTVYINDADSVTTGDDGKFSFELDDTGTYYLTTSKQGYQQKKRPLMIQIISTTLQKVEINPENITMELIEVGAIEDCETPDLDDDNDGFYDQCDVDCNGKKNIISMKGKSDIKSSETGLCSNTRTVGVDEYDLDDDCDGFANCQDSDCQGDSSCTAVMECGNGIRENVPDHEEECDVEKDDSGNIIKADDDLCPGECNNCKCALRCGNAIQQSPEHCDVVYDSDGGVLRGNDLDCPFGCITLDDAKKIGDLKLACTCKDIEYTCGDGEQQANEQCDGTDDDLCEAGCCDKNDPLPCHPCECRDTFRCGDNKINGLERCDATYDLLDNLIDGNHDKCIELKVKEEKIFGTGNSKYTGTCNPRNSAYECWCKLNCDPVSESEKSKIKVNLGTIIPSVGLLPIKFSWDFSVQSYCEPDYTDVLRCDASSDMDLTKSYDDRKTDAENYCSTNNEWAKPGIKLSTEEFTDSVINGIKPNSVYCYKLRSYYSHTDVDVYSDIQCIATGEEKCFEFSPGYEFCTYNDDGKRTVKAECNLKNFVQIKEDCSDDEGFICVGPYEDKKTRCRYQSPCHRCSDPLGMFYKDDNKITIFDLNADGVPYEKENIECSTLDTCYFDYSSSIVDYYDECIKVDSCYDYRSEETCKQNKCYAGGEKKKDIQSCEWVSSDHKEFGIGVCKPVDKELEDCSKCNSPFNKFFGKCNSNLCKSHGDCFFSESQEQCKGINDIGCDDYATRKDCIKNNNKIASNFTINITYVNNNAVYGDHRVLLLSNDNLKLGRCKWSEPDELCMKDSNNDDAEDCGDLPKTSVEYEKCKKDFTPPTTVLPDLGKLPGKGSVEFTVSDYVTISKEIKTKYSIYPKDGDFVYPNSHSIDNKMNIYVEKSGDYMLNYFSYDKAGNMEVMHQKQVFLDATPPIIEVTFSYEPHESESEDTWKSNLNIEFYAIDAEDEEVVCTTNLYFTNSDGDRILAQQDPDSDVDFSGGLDKDIVYASSKITPLQIIYRNLRDDYYEFEYECYDSSGNKNSDFKWIDIDGDKSLTDIKVNNIPVPATITSEKNPANAMYRKVKFSLKTDQVGECRYDLASVADSFFEMSDDYKFKTTDGKYHEAISDEYHYDLFNVDLNVRCKFGDGKSYGNSGDRLWFTIDNVPPRTSTEAEGKWYHLDKVDVVLECKDPSINSNPAEHLCDKTYYCIGNGCSNFRLYDAPIEFTERKKLRFYSVDKGGNEEDPRTIDVKISKDPPKVNIVVIDVLTGEEAERVTRLGSPAYLVKITSSKPLKRIHYLTFEVKGQVFKVKRPNIIKSENGQYDGKTWQSVLILSPLKPKIEGNAEFIIFYSDEEGYTTGDIEEGKFFIFDTIPPKAPVLDPFKEEYHDHYSTLWKSGNTYFTNKPNLFLTGKTDSDDQMLKVTFYLGDFNNRNTRSQFYEKHSDEKIGQVEMKVRHNPDVNQLNIFETDENLKDNYIEIPGRNDYGNYSQLYKIISKTGRQYIGIDPKLQTGVSANDDFDIYKGPILRTWFYPEIIFNTKNNYMKLRAEENFFVKSTYTPIYNVFLDSVAPEIMDAYYQVGQEQYPVLGSTINNGDARIRVKVKELKDHGSHIDDTKSLLNIYNDVDKFSSLSHLAYFSENNYFDEKYKNFWITSLGTTNKLEISSLRSGISTLNISMVDYAGNYLSQQFDVIYLPNTPAPPRSFIVTDASQYGFTYFRKTLPNAVEVNFASEIIGFTASYLGTNLQYETTNNKKFTINTADLGTIASQSPDNFEFIHSDSDNLKSKITYFEFDGFDKFKYYKVFIDDVYLMKLRANSYGKIIFRYNILGKRSYKINIIPFDEQVYPIRLSGRDIDDNPNGFWTYTLVVDSEAPNIVSDDLITARSGEKVLIKAVVDNENFDLNGKINISDFLNGEEQVLGIQDDILQSSNTEFSYELFIPENVETGEEISYMINLTDRVGRYSGSEGIIKIDNSRPYVTIENIVTGPGEQEIKTVYDHDEYYIKDYDDKINITGKITGAENVYIWHGADRIDLEFDKEGDNKGKFKLAINLTSFDNTLFPNNVIFVLDELNQIYHELVIYSDNEYPNVPIITFEDEKDGVVESTMPEIVVEYDEEVELIDFVMMDSDKEVVLPKEDISVKPVSGVNNKFTLKVEEPMENGDYIFGIKAQDSLGNMQQVFSEQECTVEAGKTKIHLIYPKHGAVRTSNFRLKIGTSNYETCKFSKQNPIGTDFIYRYDNPKLNYEFTPQNTVSLTHEADYSIDASNPANKIYVVCTDGTETVWGIFANLRVDNEDPEIISLDISKDIISYLNPDTWAPETEILVKTNEKTVCKFVSENDIDSENKYDSMDWFDDESIEDGSSYKVSHSQLITAPIQELAHKYYVACEDFAGLKTEIREVDFEVKKQALTIEIIEPLKVVPDPKFNFIVKTNQLAECNYKDNTDENAILQSMERKSDLIYKEYYSYFDEAFSAGHYTYYFKCEAVASVGSLTESERVKELVYEFVVDDTPPFISKLGILQEQFCAGPDGKYSLTFSLEGVDPESSVTGFNYTIVDSNYKPIIGEKYSPVSQKTIIVSGLVLNKELGYRLAAKAINPASSLVSTQPMNYSILLFVSEPNTPECVGDQSGPKITVKKTAVGEGIKVDLLCEDDNSCDAKKYHYNVAGSKEECGPSVPYDFEDGILLTEDSYICWLIYDNIGNFNSGTELITISDLDGDGVPDELDLKCPDTPAGEVAYTEGKDIGCAKIELEPDVVEKDSDKDGVYDKDDVCSNTPEGETVDSSGKYAGCTPEQIEYLDDDGDGIINKDDKCKDTPYGVFVDEEGCEDKEKPKPIWPWIAGLVILGVLIAGGYFVISKNPELLGKLSGKFGKKSVSGKKTASKGYRGPSQKQMSRDYVEKQLALRRRNKLKQREKSIKEKSRGLFGKFSKKLKKSKKSKSYNKEKKKNAKKGSNSFNELERLIKETRDSKKRKK